jgi:hypothetical protein
MISSGIKASFDRSAVRRSTVKIGALGHIRPNAPTTKHLINAVTRHYVEPLCDLSALLARRDFVAREQLDGAVVPIEAHVADDLAGKGSGAEVVDGGAEAVLRAVVAANEDHCVSFDTWIALPTTGPS